jgi:hypothetical protein
MSTAENTPSGEPPLTLGHQATLLFTRRHSANLFRGGHRIHLISSKIVYRTREPFGTFDQVAAGATEKH